MTNENKEVPESMQNNLPTNSSGSAQKMQVTSSESPSAPEKNGLHAFIVALQAKDGFLTEQVLHSFLPLLNQVVACHEAGHAAPLVGIDSIQVTKTGQLWFSTDQQTDFSRVPEKLAALSHMPTREVEVVSEVSYVEEHAPADDAESDLSYFSEGSDLSMGKQGEDITRPVYLPAYTAWELEVGHHDELVDVFQLGMILASLACQLDFHEADDLTQFVQNRDNLFAINPHIHPVLAKTIGQMTTIDRSERVSDLSHVLQVLENYREQCTDIVDDLKQIEGFENKTLSDKQQIILAKLQERLFDISKRNRLYHFRQTQQTVNLTQASVPLSFSVDAIRADQIFSWSDALQKQIVAEKPISLNKVLNFHEVLYLPSVLERIRSDMNKDKKEYGFSQLQLVICFLQWSNLKELTTKQGGDKLNSPLLLLPVEIVKKKGVRDNFVLEPLSSDARVNPVLRYQFKTLYDVDLPEYIDLEKTNVHVLFDSLQQQILKTAPEVTLEKVEKPKIELIYDSAKRRLDSYKKRARLSGKGVRRLMDIDYSYSRSNYNPLGIRLFNQFVRETPSSLNVYVGNAPSKTHFMAAPAATTKDTLQQGKQNDTQSFYRIKDDESDNPYHWCFDLCSVTLGNFKYRKMSLVRDYNQLINNQLTNNQLTEVSETAAYSSKGFEDIFSLTPKGFPPKEDYQPNFATDFPVVNCDPTQAAAIHHARKGESYIIQGPPGTGKSQTITNLIADYVQQGKQVLFVCEKRAAIDVVYLRMKQVGLAPLCSLIHDSQADKKHFVMDLKATYEGFSQSAGHFVAPMKAAKPAAEKETKKDSQDKKSASDEKDDEHIRHDNLHTLGSTNAIKDERTELVDALSTAMKPLAYYSQHISAEQDKAGQSLHTLMKQMLQLQAHGVRDIFSSGDDSLSDKRHFLPYFRVVHGHSAELARFSKELAFLVPSQRLYDYALKLVNPVMADDDNAHHKLTRMLAEIVASLSQLQQRLPTDLQDNASATDINDSSIEHSHYEHTTQLPLLRSMADVQDAIDYADKLKLLAEHNLFALLEPSSETHHRYDKLLQEESKCVKALHVAQEKTKHWKQKLSAEDTEAALGLVNTFTGIFTYFRPSYWSMRKLLNSHYDFSQHQVKPRWADILEKLQQEHKAAQALETVQQDAGVKLGVSMSLTEFNAQIEHIHSYIGALQGKLANLHRAFLHAEKNTASHQGIASQRISSHGTSSQSISMNSAASEQLNQLRLAAEPMTSLRQQLQHALVDYEAMSLPELQGAISDLHQFLQTVDATAFMPHIHLLRAIGELPPSLATGLRFLPCTVDELTLASAQKTLDYYLAGNRELNHFSHGTRASAIADTLSQTSNMRKVNALHVLDSVRQRFLSNCHLYSRSASELTSQQKEQKKIYNTGRRTLEHEFGKSMRYKSIRDLVAGESGEVIKDLKPVWLMSPLSVSDTLPLNALFDVVIFDEASQITLEEAIPSLFRAPQMIVVGDQMQLPPTSFFANKTVDEEALEIADDMGDVQSYDLSSNSFLNHASKNLHSRMLGWHYRSRSEHLISFSNWAFYQGGLFTIPDERINDKAKPALEVTTVSDAVNFLPDLLNRAVSFHDLSVTDGLGIYENRTNTDEAAYIAHMVRALLFKNADSDDAGLEEKVDANSHRKQHSIGIIAFSEAQQRAIETALTNLANQDSAFATLYEAELEREEDGEFVGLLVKNLENIQGDERDVIIISICYGYNAEGKMRMNFGPINQVGGEKRLNVAFSRAKHHMAVVSSIVSSDITNDYNQGAKCLKNYLRYAQALSEGNMQQVNQVLFELGNQNPQQGTRTVSSHHKDMTVTSIKAALEAAGFIVDTQVGQSQFTCDLAVRKASDEEYRLGILVDSAGYYDSFVNEGATLHETVLDADSLETKNTQASDADAQQIKQINTLAASIMNRDVERPQLLELFGWKMDFVLTKDWLLDREGTFKRIVAKLS